MDNFENLDLRELDNLGIRYFNEKNFIEEIKVWEKVVSLDDNLLYKSNLATALMHAGRLNEALELFNLILKEDNLISRALFNRALLLLKIGYTGEELLEDLLVALVTSDDESFYARHFFMFCMALSTSQDRNRKDIIHLFESIAKEPPVLEHLVSQKSSISNNCQEILEAFKHIFEFYDALSAKKWGVAETKLRIAKAELNKIKNPDFAPNIAIYYERFYSILNLAIKTIDLIGNKEIDLKNEIKQIQRTLYFLKIHSSQKIENSTYELASLFGNLFFLIELLLIHNDYYPNLTEVLEVIRGDLNNLSEGKFSVLGRCISSISDLISSQIIEFNIFLEENTNEDIIYKKRIETWTITKLAVKGSILDFKNITQDAAKNLFGWKSNEFTKFYEDLCGFIYFIERQAFKDIYDHDLPLEKNARSLLQAYLTSRSYREVPVGSGKTDILIFLTSERILIETKIWRGPESYEQGIREISEYYKHENSDGLLKNIYYLLFDPTSAFSSKKYLGIKEKVIVNDLVKINIILIHINPEYPSKVKSTRFG